MATRLATDVIYRTGSTQFYGNYVIFGSVKKVNDPSNTPVYRKLRLHDTVTGFVIQNTLSDAVTGEYTFDNIPFSSYYVVAFDHTGEYNGVIATNVTPSPK